MKKKITVVDKTFTPIVVLADANSAIYEDRGQRPGEQNLLSETVITCTAMDGTKKVATMKASILQVPTKFMPAATTSAPGIPAKQLAINYLCDKSAEVDERYDREKNDNIAMILPVTTHLYIDSLEVEEPYRNRGIATAMLDFIISMAVPESICLFAAKEDAEMQRKLRQRLRRGKRLPMSKLSGSLKAVRLRSLRKHRIRRMKMVQKWRAMKCESADGDSTVPYLFVVQLQGDERQALFDRYYCNGKDLPPS